MSEKIEFEGYEFNTPLWSKLKRFMEQRVADYNKKNANSQLSNEQHKVMCGHLAELDYLIGLDKPKMLMDEPPTEEVPESSNPDNLY